MSESIYTFTANNLTGQDVALADYRGSVLLIVNTASQCGFTPQYTGLEALYQQYREQGLVVLGFPCNQFGAQEPGDAQAISDFCSTRFSVSFPMFAKIDVNGAQAHPLYTYLKHQAKGLLGSEAIKWNFTKFLVNRKGEVVARFAPSTTPKAMVQAIEACLAEQ